MTDDEIQQRASKLWDTVNCGWCPAIPTRKEHIAAALRDLAAQVARETREACAQIVDREACNCVPPRPDKSIDHWSDCPKHIVAAIRQPAQEKAREAR